MPATPPPAGQPQTLDAVAGALAQASPAELHRHARLFDEAGRSLREITEAFDRTLAEVDEAWQGVAAVSARSWEPLLRSRRLLHAMDSAGYGDMLRVAADSLAASQLRLQDLLAQRAGSSEQSMPYDQQARLVLQGVSDRYRDIGLSLGGQPPQPAAADEGPENAPLHLAAAAGSEAVDLFRPASPSLGGRQPGDPVVPPSGGGGGGAGTGGFPMMPFMPMGGMGGMAGGMGGMQIDAAGQRRSGTVVQGDQAIWADQDGGWNVLGRRDRTDVVREERRKRSKGDKDG